MKSKGSLEVEENEYNEKILTRPRRRQTILKSKQASKETNLLSSRSFTEDFSKNKG